MRIIYFLFAGTLAISACGGDNDSSNKKFYTKAPELTNGKQLDSIRNRYYPKEFRARGISGRVEVGLFINARSQVTTIRIADGSGIRELDSAAMKVARALKWNAAQNGTKPVGAYIRFPITFGPQSQ